MSESKNENKIKPTPVETTFKLEKLQAYAPALKKIGDCSSLTAAETFKVMRLLRNIRPIEEDLRSCLKATYEKVGKVKHDGTVDLSGAKQEDIDKMNDEIKALMEKVETISVVPIDSKIATKARISPNEYLNLLELGFVEEPADEE